MDPENDIYALAQQHGLVGPTLGMDPSALAPPQEQPSQFSPVTGNLTDEDILAHFVPPSAEGLVTQPSQVEPPSPTPSKVKLGAEVTSKGFSEAKNQQIARGPGARLDQRIAGIEERGVAQAAERSALPIEAANQEKAAEQAYGDNEGALIQAQGRYKALEAQIKTNYDQQTETTIAEHQAAAASTKANYVAALNDFRAARVNPAQLWDYSSGGEQVGLMAMAFAKDFLGAKGVNTSAMDTWNKAVDRNIDAQVRAIQTKGDVAQGFKQLWDMQMQESTSVQETRLRMRGFMLDSFKTAVESQLAPYQSALANAKTMAAVAKIDQELVKTINEINKHQDTVTAQRIQQALQRHGDELQASTAYARIKADKEIAELNRKAAKGPGDPYENLIFDTTESGGGRPIAVFNEGVDATTKRDFLDKQATSSKLVQLSREYQSLLMKKGNQGILGGTRWQDTDTAKLRNVAYEILNTRIKMQTGAAMSEPEAKRIKTATPEALFGTQFNIGEVVAQTQKHIQDELSIRQQGIARPLHPADPRTQLANPRVIQGQSEYAEAELIESGADREKDINKSIVEGRIKGLEKHSANKEAKTPPSDVYADYKRFTDDYGTGGPNPEHKSDKGDKPRQFAEALTGIKRDALYFKQLAEEKAERVGKDPNAEIEAKYYADLYKERVDILRHIAKPVTVGTKPDDRQGLYSIMVLQDMGEDTGSPKEDLETSSSSTAQEEIDPRAR